MMSLPTIEHIKKAITSFSRRKILVVGDVMLDLYVEGPPRFVSQEAPVVVIRVERKYFKLGGAANTAENIQALGGRVELAGVVGNHSQHDDVGRSLMQTIRRSKLSTRGLCMDSSRPTTMKMRVMSQDQQIVRVDEEVTTQIPATVEAKLIRFVVTTAPRMDAILVSDYQKGVVTKKLMKTIVQAAKKNAIPVIVDPRPEHRDRYRGVHLITPNEHELSHMFGHYEVNQRQLRRLALELRRKLAVEYVLLTRGERGMDVVDKTGRIRHVPTFARTVQDVSGAGDTVAAVMALSYNTLDIFSSTILASVAAKISVGKIGTATVSVDELRAAIDQETASIQKLLS